MFLFLKMGKNIKFSYKIFTISLITFAILIGFIFAIDSPGHSADQILITVNGYTMTLQEALDNNFLAEGGAVPTHDYTTNLNPGHLGSEIMVVVEEGQMSIQDVIDNDLSFDANEGSFFSNLISFGHGGDKIEVTDINGQKRNFQNLINSGELAYSYSWKYTEWTDCSNNCGTGDRARNVWCERNDGLKITEGEEEFCKDARPDESESCTVISYNWNTSDPACPDPNTYCGDKSINRDVWCERCDGLKEGIADADCDATTKPSSLKTCPYDLGPYTWYHDPYDCCSVTTGIAQEYSSPSIGSCIGWECGRGYWRNAVCQNCRGALNPYGTEYDQSKCGTEPYCYVGTSDCGWSSVTCTFCPLYGGTQTCSRTCLVPGRCTGESSWTITCTGISKDKA